jgi:ABC-type multidrug transport system permease subunit
MSDKIKVKKNLTLKKKRDFFWLQASLFLFFLVGAIVSGVILRERVVICLTVMLPLAITSGLIFAIYIAPRDSTPVKF